MQKESISKRVGRMPETRLTEGYRKAHQRWRKLAKPMKGVDASQRLSRDDAHGRR